MEAAGSNKTLVHVHQTTGSHNLEDHHNSHLLQDKSYNITLV
jgi:hypothetical protein